MAPLWLALVFGSVVMFYMAQDVPRKAAEYSKVVSDVGATNFVAYRTALIKYLAANPGASGTISDAALAGYWVLGYVRDARWTNTISGGKLYVHSTGAVGSAVEFELFNRSGGNVLVGHKDAATGRLFSFNGTDTGIALPGGIVNNATVIMGN